MNNTHTELDKLSPQEKIVFFKEEAMGAFPANSICYDLNELFNKFKGYEVFVWNAVMILVEQGYLNVIQTKLYGKDKNVRYIVTYPSVRGILSNDEFYPPTGVKK